MTRVLLSFGAVVGSGAALGLLFGAMAEFVAARRRGSSSLARYATASSIGAVVGGAVVLAVAVAEELLVR